MLCSFISISSIASVSNTPDPGLKGPKKNVFIYGENDIAYIAYLALIACTVNGVFENFSLKWQPFKSSRLFPSVFLSPVTEHRCDMG